MPFAGVTVVEFGQFVAVPYCAHLLAQGGASVIKVEALTGDLIDRSISTCERILQESGSTRDALDEMLLVGGQSCMPLVRTKLEQFVGKPPSHKVHPDEAVAIGAAIMAHSLSSKSGPQDMTLLDVLPMAIGINHNCGCLVARIAPKMLRSGRKAWSSDRLICRAIIGF